MTNKKIYNVEPRYRNAKNKPGKWWVVVGENGKVVNGWYYTEAEAAVKKRDLLNAFGGGFDRG